METTNTTTENFFTRADYMNKKCTHHEYYSQFVDNTMKQSILSRHSKEVLTACYNQDEHLNNIPLQWWDSLSLAFKSSIAATNKKINGTSTWCLSDGVCALKAAARQIINE